VASAQHRDASCSNGSWDFNEGTLPPAKSAPLRRRRCDRSFQGPVEGNTPSMHNAPELLFEGPIKGTTPSMNQRCLLPQMPMGRKLL
jgi:hypothetical protein